MPTAEPRRQAPDVRREQLLDAAQLVLVERGLRATTVADVAERAGVAKGTTYLYFGSKDELIAGVRARYLERFTAALTSDATDPAQDRLRSVVGGLFDIAVEHHRLHHVLFHEAGFSEADAFTAVRALVVEILEEGAASGELAIEDIDVAASFLLHGVHGALVDSLHPERHGSDGGGVGRTPDRTAGEDVADAVATLVRRATTA